MSQLITTSQISGLAAAIAAGTSAGFPIAIAGGSSDTITASFTPAIIAVSAGLTVLVRAGAINTTTTPTFSPNGLTPRVIYKGQGQPLLKADIAGSGHWLELTYDSTIVGWCLNNPGYSVQGSGSLSGYQNITSNTTLTASSLGQYLNCYPTSPITVNIPAPGTVPSGSKFIFTQSDYSGISTTTITPASGVINNFNLATSSSIVLQRGRQIELVSDNGTNWFLTNGGGSSSIATNGYQKFPGGAILQWGTLTSVPVDTTTAITFPVTFPNSCTSLGYSCLASDNASKVFAFQVTTPSTTGVSISYTRLNNSAPTATILWTAIGY